MEQRKIIEERIYIQILPGSDYKQDVSPKQLFETKGLLDTDRVIALDWKKWDTVPFGSYDGESVTYYSPCVVVLRKRPETDDEYFKRMKEETQRNKDIEERERLEYLRLKAKFESNQNDENNN